MPDQKPDPNILTDLVRVRDIAKARYENAKKELKQTQSQLDLYMATTVEEAFDEAGKDGGQFTFYTAGFKITAKMARKVTVDEEALARARGLLPGHLQTDLFTIKVVQTDRQYSTMERMARESNENSPVGRALEYLNEGRVVELGAPTIINVEIA